MTLSANVGEAHPTGAPMPVEAQGSHPLSVHVRPAVLDRLLWPIHWLVFRDAHRRAHKLLRFAETEADGGRDLARAAELTQDALLRRLYLRHAIDEQRHADLFRRRARHARLAAQSADAAVRGQLVCPGERGLDDLRVERRRTTRYWRFFTCPNEPPPGVSRLREVLQSIPRPGRFSPTFCATRRFT